MARVVFVDVGSEKVMYTDYMKVRNDVFEFCRYYARLLGSPLAERLKAEISQLLEEAISRWFQQMEMEAMG